MLYYKVLRDKHDNSLINTLRDLNDLLQTGKPPNTTLIHQNNENVTDSQQEMGSSDNQGPTQKNYFVKFEHTIFSD